MQIGFKIFYILIFFLSSIYFSYRIIKYFLLKLKCKKIVDATIVDMTLTRLNRGGKCYINTYEYSYNGQKYTVKGNNGFVYGPNVLDERMGTKVQLHIDENDPTRIYDDLGYLIFFSIMFLILSLVMLVVSILFFN